MISVELVDEVNEDIINGILEIYKTYYNSSKTEFDFLYFRSFYKKVLTDSKSTLFLLKNENNILGYIYGIPQNIIFPELVRFDPEIKYSSNNYYVDSLEVRRNCGNVFGFLRLIKNIVNEATKKGFYIFSMYTRSEITHRLINILLKEVADNIEIKRTIKGNWYGTEELYDYLEVTVRQIIKKRFL